MIPNVFKKSAARWFAGSAVAGVVIVTAAVVLAGGGEEGPSREWQDEVPQSAEASDSGIHLRVLGALFSGSETVVRMEASIDYEKLGVTSAARVQVPQDGLTDTSFAEPTARSATNPLGELLVYLPPVDASNRTGPTVGLHLQALEIVDGTDLRHVNGEWSLELTLPAADVDRYRIERASGTADVDGVRLEASMLRSASQTVVEYTTSPATLYLAPQALVTEGGNRHAPYEIQQQGDTIFAYFNPTEFGSTVTFEMGAVAVADDGAAHVLGIRVAEAFERQQVAMTPGQSVTVAPEDVAYGDGSLALAVSIGEYGERKWVELLVPGQWHVEWGEPTITGTDGEELELAHAQVQYTKDPDLSVRPGTSRIAAFFDDPSQLSIVTFALAGESRIVPGPWKVDLAP